MKQYHAQKTLLYVEIENIKFINSHKVSSSHPYEDNFNQSNKSIQTWKWSKYSYPRLNHI